MKKIFYSPIMKVSALFLIFIFAFTGLYQFTKIVPQFEIGSDRYDYEVQYQEDMYSVFNYVFDLMGMQARSESDDFYERRDRIRSLDLNSFEYYGENASGQYTNLSEEEKSKVQEAAKQALEPYGDVSLVDEYLKQGGVILFQKDGNITIYHDQPLGYYFNDISDEDFAICIKPTQEYMAAYNENIEKAAVEYDEAMNNIENSLAGLLVYVVAIIILECYLFWVCGKNGEDDEVHMLLIDRIYVEILLFAGGTVFVLGMLALIGCFNFILDEGGGNFFNVLAAITGTVTGGIVLSILLSFVRNLKNRTLVKRSLILTAAVWLWKLLKEGVRNVKKGLSLKTGAIVGVIIAIYGLAMIIIGRQPFIGIVLTAVMIILSLKAVVGFDELRKGIDELGKGNTTYKINSTDSGIVGDLCRAVDNVGEGMTAAVEKQLAAERMKSQLITNVSHDLKTPLTSIINYSELLKDMELTPEEANDYVKIIENKSLKLKALTSDLFDISKVQSGNEVMNFEELDAGILINQSMGELDEEIEKSGLEFNVHIDEDCIIQGDGDKLSRVFENLLVNAVKYSMKGTRVYVNVLKKNNGVFIEIKNISSYPLDFDDEEITERFVRADASRSTEGNGLGLAIAKSYTEAMGGKFKVITDGDLFKVIIEWN